MTGSRTTGVVTVFTYDWTRAWLNVLPCCISWTEPEFWIATNNCVSDVYVGFDNMDVAPAMSRPAIVAATTKIQLRRKMRM